MACANSTNAVGITQPSANLSERVYRCPGAYVEGYVRLHYKINPDGHVSDIATIAVVGPQKFADITVAAVKGWVYRPATLDGKAVPICRTMLMTFKIPTKQPGGRSTIVSAYRAAVQDIKDSKWDGASSICPRPSPSPN